MIETLIGLVLICSLIGAVPQLIYWSISHWLFKKRLPRPWEPIAVGLLASCLIIFIYIQYIKQHPYGWGTGLAILIIPPAIIGGFLFISLFFSYIYYQKK